MRRFARWVGLAMLSLSACGGVQNGSGSMDAVSTDGVPRFASGPIQVSCSRQARTAATRARCGCVQAAANLTLTPEEQLRSASYFEKPELLQERKLSDTPANERFWYRWERFYQTAEDMCRQT